MASVWLRAQKPRKQQIRAANVLALEQFSVPIIGIKLNKMKNIVGFYSESLIISLSNWYIPLKGLHIIVLYNSFYFVFVLKKVHSISIAKLTEI